MSSVSLDRHGGNMPGANTPHGKVVRPLGSCVRFTMMCRKLSPFTRPAAHTMYFEVTKRDRECRSISEMHAAVEARQSGWKASHTAISLPGMKET